MERQKPSFWSRIFGSFSTRSGRQEKVIAYIVHRVGKGVPLQDVLQEEYVRRHASPSEVQTILDNPELVEAARKKLQEDFSSGRLDAR